MRKYEKIQCADMLRTLDEAHGEIGKFIEKKDTDSAFVLLEQCQQAAMAIGEIIERSEGEGTEAVTRLEGYCEYLYEIHESLASDKEINAHKAEKNLRKIINGAQAGINALPTRIEAVFLPYKAAMWDSLESIWMAADADPECDAYVVPIPYFDRNPDGSFAKVHYEAAMYPDYVPITDYAGFNIEEHHPDMIFIHNPYDQYNYVTSVHPDFYSKNLRDKTDCLVYVPYYASAGAMMDGQSMCAAYVYADYIVVQSERFIEYFDESIPREKFLPFGSPKFDSVIRKCNNPPDPPDEWKEKLKRRKVFFYNTSISGFLDNPHEFLKKMRYVFDTFKKHDEACLIWRPHPLLESTIDSMRPDIRPLFDEIKEGFINEQIGILDTTPQIEDTIALSDAYIGDAGTSVTSLFGVAGKPIYLLNNYIHSEPDEDDWRGTISTAPAWDGNDRYVIQMGNKLFKRDDNYHYRYFCELSEYSGGDYYCVAYELNDNVYVFPRNAEDIIVINEDKSIRKIKLRHEMDRAGAFYGAIYMYGHEKYVFLLPDRYPYMVRFNTETEELDYLDGVSGYNITMTNEGERAIAAVGVDFSKKSIFLLNPEGTEMLSIEIDTLETSKRRMNIGSLIRFVASPSICGDEWYFVPYQGTDIVKWTRSKDKYETIHAGINGLEAINRTRNFLCDKNYFITAVFTKDNKMILSPDWGNKFVKINLKTNEAKEWIPPFEISTEKKNEYWKSTSIGWFITDAEAWMKDKISPVVKFYYSPLRRTYSINLGTGEYEEFPVSFDREDYYSHSDGFGRDSKWMPYCCWESVLNPLSNMITEDLAGDKHDRVKQLEEYRMINASYDGCCGDKVYCHIRRQLGAS